MRILILGDSNWRDSFGLALLKHELQKELPDADIWVVSADIILDAVKLFKPHAVILTHAMGKRNREIANYVKRQGGVSIVMPSEGRVNTDEQFDWFVEQNDNPRYVDLFLSWNEILADRFSNIETAVVGCPRFDIYQEPYSQLIEDRDTFCERYGIDKGKRTITFASSFPQAKFTYRNRQFNIRDSKDLKTTAIEGREDPEQLAREEYDKLQEFMLWARIVAVEFPEFNILLKPHPMEDIVEWRKLADDIGATLIPGDYIFNVLSATDLLIARAGCLTLQDAWLMNPNPFTVHAIIDDDDFTGPTSESIEYGYTRAVGPYDLISAIYSFSQYASPDLSDPQPFLDKWGFSVENSAIVTAHEIERFLDRKQPQVKDISLQDYKKLSQMVYNHNANNSVMRQDYGGHFGKAVTKNIIDNWMKRIENL